jgi:hypothetical protein
MDKKRVKKEITDPRFQRAATDPRFAKMKAKKAKVTVDPRFQKMFEKEEFQVSSMNAFCCFFVVHSEPTL